MNLLFGINVWLIILLKIPLVQLKLVFDNLAREKTVDGSTISYLESMLPFVLKEFLKQDKSWTDFPFQVLISLTII